MAHNFTVKDFLAVLENIASFGLAEVWDNVGLMVGNPAQEVSGVLVALDPTESILEEAIRCEVNTIVTHHPLIFQPIKTVRTDQVVGRFLRKAIENDITVVGCHTNLDQAFGGVSDALAAKLGLIDVQPITSITREHTSTASPGRQTAENDMARGIGFGRYGRFPKPLASSVFLRLINEALGLPVVAVAGKLPEEIATVAVCGGSGSDLAELALEKGVQVYITGEVKHNIARWAEACDFCIIDAGHFSTENPVVEALVMLLRKTVAEKGWKTNIMATKKQKSPFMFYHNASVIPPKAESNKMDATS